MRTLKMLSALWCLALSQGCDDATADPSDAAQQAGAPDLAMTEPDGSRDAELLDAAQPDALLPDAQLPDAQLPDAQQPDAQQPDAQLPDGPPFSFPIAIDDRDLMVPNLVFGFDHDPAPGQRINCSNYNGDSFPFCYDGHTGSDFVLAGQFQTMDAGSARIVAAAAGEVIRTEDGNYDRCHVSLETNDVTCDGHPMRANSVTIRHADGWVTLYAHMMKDTVAVEVGQWVECGTLLGLVGSSGYSTFPHLHLEVISPEGESVDPYAGPESQARSFWLEQRDGQSLPPTVCPTP